MHFLATLFIGFLAGWLVGVATRGHGFGLLGNIAVGIVGSIVGSFIFGVTGLVAVTWTGEILRSVVGALACLFIVALVRPGARAPSESE